MKRWITGVAALMCCHTAAAQETIVGRASVVDGDTIDIGKVRVRLQGVDAPERSQRCADGGGNVYRCGKEARMKEFASPH